MKRTIPLVSRLLPLALFLLYGMRLQKDSGKTVVRAAIINQQSISLGRETVLTGLTRMPPGLTPLDCWINKNLLLAQIEA